MPGQFPQTVISRILRFIYAVQEDGTGVGDLNLDVPSLQAYSLVSRSWRTESQHLLFHQANFTSMRRFMRIRTGMKASPAVTAHVRVLSLGIGQNYQTHVQGTELPDIMGMFPYLYELRLHLDRPAALPMRTIQQLSSPQTPPISALRITLGTIESPDFLLQLLQVPWPLQYLSISQPHSLATDAPCITAKELHEQTPPSWKLTEYRTDAFSGWEAVLEWVVLYSLETLTILHMPPAPQSVILTLVSPRLRSLNLVYDPTSPNNAFDGMESYPPFPELQELTLTNAVLTPGQKKYQSIPFSVCHFGTTLRIKLRNMIEICPTIPMRMETITVHYDGNLGYGWKDMVQDYVNLDGRLKMKRRLAEYPPMVPFHDVPRDDTWLAKRAMDAAVADRVVPSTPPPATPKLLRRLLSTGGTRLSRALSLSRDAPSAFKRPMNRNRAGTTAMATTS